MMICIPIVADTMEDALRQMEKSASLADILELRIDRIKDLRLQKLMNEKETKIVVTNRRRDEGGEFSGSEQERIELLKEAVALRAEYVDIEAGTERHLIEELVAEIKRCNHGTKWIVSSHDFSGTPPEGTLRKRFDMCSRAGADIVKLCTYAHTREDNLRVLGLIPYARSKGQAIIALCMGEQGKISRVVAPLLGAQWSYAFGERGAESAPGQLAAEEMRLIYRILGVADSEEH